MFSISNRSFPLGIFLLLGSGFLFGLQVPLAHATTVYVPNVTGLYHFDNSATDSSGNGRNFTATGGGFVSSTAKLGTYAWDSISITETSNNLKAASSVISSWGDFTIGYWINPQTDFAASPGYGYVLTTDFGTTNSVNFGYNRLCLNSFEFKLITTCQTTSGITLTTSTWHFVLLVRNGSTTDFYVDNVLKETKTVPGTFSANSEIQVNGQAQDHQGLDFLIDELFFSNAAISTGTRNALYNNNDGAEVCLTESCDDEEAPVTVIVTSSTPAQYRSNGSTSINVGSSTPQSTVKFSGTVSTTGSSSVKLWIEVQPSSTAFTNTPTTSSTFVASNETATTTLTGLANGGYHWQVKAVDQNNVSSTWYRFGANATGTDFVVSVSTATSTLEISDGSITGLYHFNNELFDAADGIYDFTATGGAFAGGKLGSGSWDSLSTTDTTNNLQASQNVITNYSDFTVGFWVNPQTAFNVGYVLTTDFGTVTSVNFGEFRLCLDSFEYKLISTCQNVSGINLSTNDWHFVLLTRNGTTTNFYVDNDLKETRSISGTFSSNSPIRINGQAQDHVGLDFLIDELFFRNAYTNTSTRTVLWNGGFGRSICITAGCGTATGTEPIVIIPGIMGTKLKTASSGAEVWPSAQQMHDSASDDYLNDLKLSSTTFTEAVDMNTGDILRVATASGGPFHWFSGGEIVYQDLIELLNVQGYAENANLFVAPYDWRFSVASSVSEIAPVIQSAINSSPNGKINVIAHSMGGLLMKSYLQDATSTSFINKLILAGVPQLGAPRAFTALNYESNFGIDDLNEDKVKEISQNMPGVYDLLPSREYIDSVGGYVQDFRTTSTIFGYDETNAFMTSSSTDSRNAALLSLSDNFHQSIDDEQFNVASSSVYNIIGCNTPTFGTFEIYEDELHVKPVTGDGTVPLTSAYNLPAGYYNYFAKPGFWGWEDNDHLGLVRNGSPLDLIQNILNGNQNTLPSNISTSTSGCSDDIDEDEVIEVISTHSPVELHVYDELGRHTGPNHEKGTIDREIPRSSYDAITHNNFVMVPGNRTYKILVDATGVGKFDLDIETYFKYELRAKTEYDEIPVPSADTMAQATLTPPDRSPRLYVDTNNDKITDVSYEPTRIENFGTIPLPKPVMPAPSPVPHPAPSSSPTSTSPSSSTVPLPTPTEAFPIQQSTSTATSTASSWLRKLITLLL